MKQLVLVMTAAGVLGISGSVLGEPARLTDAQMDQVVAGEFTVDTQGQNLELIATGNSINSCHNDQCYWYNTKSGKEIGKPVKLDF